MEGDPHERTLLITAEVDAEMCPDTWEDQSYGHRLAQLAADFDRFVIGDMIPVGMTPYEKEDNAFLARIDPPEYGIWAIRSVAPKPSIRVLGAFCDTDTFIALAIRDRASLGGRKDIRWARARENAIAIWSALFPGHNPHAGADLNDFISEKAIAV
ncbi:hypothetical protein ACW9UR_17265 [Halovulum sp. GXIMD14794]